MTQLLLTRIRSGLFEVATHTPSAPRRMTLWAVVTLFSALLAWALVARIDIVSVAHGRLVPETQVKIVQPAEAGIIREILVRDGDSVEKDQVLIRLDPTESTADSSANSQQLALEKLHARRLEAELRGGGMQRLPGDNLVLFSRVEAQFRAHILSVEDSRRQAEAARDRVSKQLAAELEELQKLERIAPMLRDAADSYRKLADQNLVGRLEAQDRHQLATEREQDLKSQRSRVESARAALKEAESAVEQVNSRNRSELEMALTEATGRVAQLEQAAVKLGFRSSNLDLRAPQAGIVKDLVTTTLGAVVQPGTVLLSLVPVGDRLRAEVSVNNEDIGFLRVGQEVRLKLATFPFQRYGMLEGKLESLSADVALESNNAVTDHGAKDPPAYKAVIRLDEQHLQGGMGTFALSAGMQLTAEIVEGNRTVMRYLTSPVQRVANEAGRER